MYRYRSLKQQWSIARNKRLQVQRRTDSERIQTERIVRALARAAGQRTGTISRMSDDQLEAHWHRMSRLLRQCPQPWV